MMQLEDAEQRTSSYHGIDTFVNIITEYIFLMYMYVSQVKGREWCWVAHN